MESYRKFNEVNTLRQKLNKILKKRGFTLVQSLSLALALVIIIFCFRATCGFAAHGTEIKVKIDGKEQLFPDAKPYADEKSGRIFVPIRFVAESLDAGVTWKPKTKTVQITKDHTQISLKIGEKEAMVNGIAKPIDVAAFSLEGRIFVPVRFVSENLDVDVVWEQETSSILLSRSNYSGDKNLKDDTLKLGFSLGSSVDSVKNELGRPGREDLSEYGFQWFIYNNDYSKYLQVGIKDNKVVGLYTNAGYRELVRGINIGMKKNQVENLLGQPLKSILKGNINYVISNQNEKSVYLIDGAYVTIFYDLYNNNTVTAIRMIDKKNELELPGYYFKYSEEIRASFEREIFDLANAVRTRNNLTLFIWSDKASICARKHSQDMASHNYFNHINLSGLSPFDRMKNEGISFSAASENISSGAPSAIEAHELWMNSPDHRKNILDAYQYMGAGVGYNSGSVYKYYYTQNFYTGK